MTVFVVFFVLCPFSLRRCAATDTRMFLSDPSFIRVILCQQGDAKTILKAFVINK